jgi:universal stress protein A
VEEERMLSIKRILVPIDFSASSRAALSHAAQLAEALGASVEILHVHEPTGYVGPDTLVLLPVDLSSDRWEQAKRESLRDIDRFLGADRDRMPGLVVKVEPGTPAEVIPAVARADGADLIVMGTHGRRGLSRLVVGSVAESVMRRSHCPVMTLRMPATRPVREAVPM